MLKDRVLKFLKLEGLTETLSDYVETKFALLKLEIKEEVIELISKVLVGLLIFGTMIFALLLLSFAAAYAIGLKLGMTIGFIIVAGFYLLLMVLFFVNRKELAKKLEIKLNDIKKKKIE
jgi:hypothetical protein